MTQIKFKTKVRVWKHHKGIESAIRIPARLVHELDLKDKDCVQVVVMK